MGSCLKSFNKVVYSIIYFSVKSLIAFFIYILVNFRLKESRKIQLSLEKLMF